jgi:hypothetical protein
LALSATSAAPGFFHPITISAGHYKETFRDGATGCNNPVREVYYGARDLWNNAEFCVVSIGTGLPAKSEFGDDLRSLLRALIKISTETERTNRQFASEHRDLEYFRFNVGNGLGDIELYEHEKSDEILANSKKYLERHIQKDLEQCVGILRGCKKSRGKNTTMCDIKCKIYAKVVNLSGLAVKQEFDTDLPKWTESPTSIWSQFWKSPGFYILVTFIALICPLLLLLAPQGPDLPAVNSNWPVFAVMGRTGAGKSTFINTLGGRHSLTREIAKVGSSLDSCSFSITSGIPLIIALALLIRYTGTRNLSWYEATVDSQSIYLIDTPGFDDIRLEDSDILRLIWDNFSNTSKDKTVTGIIFLQEITQTRAGSSLLKVCQPIRAYMKSIR